MATSGARPTSIRARMEDRLNELAEAAEGLHEPRLAAAIRASCVIAAEVNARDWLAHWLKGNGGLAADMERTEEIEKRR